MAIILQAAPAVLGEEAAYDPEPTAFQDCWKQLIFELFWREDQKTSEKSKNRYRNVYKKNF